MIKSHTFSSRRCGVYRISFYLNFNFFFLKIEAGYSIARIINSGCNLTPRLTLAFECLCLPLNPSKSEVSFF